MLILKVLNPLNHLIKFLWSMYKLKDYNQVAIFFYVWLKEVKSS